MLYTIRQAQYTDNQALTALCALPMQGAISLSFEREPDFFLGAQVQCDQPEVYVVLDKNGQVAACFGVGRRLVWVNGERTTCRYLSDLRIAPEAQGNRIFFAIGKYVQAHCLEAGRPAQTIIFSENQRMIDLVAQSGERSARLGLPYYHAAGKYHSYLLALGKQYAFSAYGKYQIAPCSQADLSDLQAFYDHWVATTNFAPQIDFSTWASGGDTPHSPKFSQLFVARLDGEIRGICGIWDQKPFKQTRVHGYSTALRWLIPVSNLLSPLTGAIKMPPRGATIPYSVLHTTCALDSDAFGALLVYLRNTMRGSGYAYLLGGAFAGTSEQQVLGEQPHSRTMEGQFFWVAHEATLAAEYQRSPGCFEIGRI